MNLADVGRLGTVGRVGLHLHAVGATGEVEVVDVKRAHRRLQTLVDLGHRNAQGSRLGFVHLDLELRCRRAEERIDAGELRTFLEFPHKLLNHVSQLFRIAFTA